MNMDKVLCLRRPLSSIKISYSLTYANDLLSPAAANGRDCLPARTGPRQVHQGRDNQGEGRHIEEAQKDSRP